MGPGRSGVRSAGAAVGMALLAPGLVFCAVAARPGAVCLDEYTWSAGRGFTPSSLRCDPGRGEPAVRAAAFYGRSVVGLMAGRPGVSRDDPDRTLLSWTARRVARSGAVLAVAAGVIGAAWVAAAWMPRPRSRVGRAGPWGPFPGGLPVPVASLLVFVGVLRLVPSGSAWDWDRAGLFWAGAALALGDGVAVSASRGLGAWLQQARSRPWAEALTMWGLDARQAVSDATAAPRAAILRAGIIGLMAGLPVVEKAFSVDGLGEALRDLVVDRRGLDGLALIAVLVAFSLGLVVLQLLPLEWVGRRWHGMRREPSPGRWRR